MALALALLTMMTMLVGCGNNNSLKTGGAGTDVPVEDVTLPLAETATISGLTKFPAGSESEPNNRTIFKRLEEATNVHVDWRSIQSDQWADTISLEMSNASTLPDFVFDAGFSDADLFAVCQTGRHHPPGGLH